MRGPLPTVVFLHLLISSHLDFCCLLLMLLLLLLLLLVTMVLAVMMILKATSECHELPPTRIYSPCPPWPSQLVYENEVFNERERGLLMCGKDVCWCVRMRYVGG